MRVLVCGSRDWHEPRVIYDHLERLSREWGPDVVVIDGDGRGVDRMAGYWARKHRFTNVKFPPNWKGHGKAAGPIRNQQMIDDGRPDLVVAFPGGSGTADMVRRAKAAGVPVVFPLPARIADAA